MARYDATRNRMVRTDEGGEQLRRQFTAAEINAGAELIPAGSGLATRILDFTMIAIGGAAAGATSVDIIGTRTTPVVLASVAVAALTRSAPVKPESANVTLLADGASFAPVDANTAVTIGKVGGTLITATAVLVLVTFAQE